MTCNHVCIHCGDVKPTMATPTMVTPTTTTDPVHRPEHYTHGSVEVFDMMVAIWGAEKVRIFCEINAFKYRMRAGYKADAGQDIEKAKWYERKAKEI
jgi:hypothetical protein